MILWQSFYSWIFIIASFIGTNKGKVDVMPNIICILVDDLGYGDLSFQGATDLLTPNIDNIAKGGMTFTNFYANCTVCSPTRASFLTGKYPDLVGVPGVIRQNEENNFGYLDPTAKTVPELLNRKGYHTALIGKWHLGYEPPNIPNRRGFDLFHGFLGDMMDDYYTHLRGGENWMRHNEEIVEPEGHATDIFTDWTIDYLEERKNKPDPFFLFLSYNAPHFPIQPPKEFLEKVKKRDPDLDPKRAANVAFIEHLDYNIGRVMESMKNLGLLENTLIVFTSDNGGALRFAQSNGDLRGGKQEHYEGGIKVPCYVSWKGEIPAGTVNSNFGITMDLLPTFCELAGVATPGDINGISLLPLIENPKLVAEDRFVFWVRREGWSYGGQAYYAGRYGDYKILQNSAFEPMQYFNIAQDPYELTNLDPGSNKMFGEIKKELMLHIKKSGTIPWQEN